jgi:hypothetical protein
MDTLWPSGDVEKLARRSDEGIVSWLDVSTTTARLAWYHVVNGTEIARR